MMRSLLLALCFCPPGLFAQPGGPSFIFVLAENQNELVPLARRVAVTWIAHERLNYVGINATYAGPLEELSLQGGPLFRDNVEQWVTYQPPEQFSTEAHLSVIAGRDTMLIEFPTDPVPLIERAHVRWDRDTPEVIRFKPGRYVLTDMIAEPWCVNAAKVLAGRLIAEDEASYRRQLVEQEIWYKAHPPEPPPPPPAPPPPLMTQERFDSIAATWGSLEKAELEARDFHRDSTVWVRITGTITLNGGCASAMPMFAIEQRVDGAWTTRLPMEEAQMDCGMPRATWKDHRVGFDLAWWTRTNQPEGRKELSPGRYRLVFKGGNLREVRTEAFDLH